MKTVLRTGDKSNETKAISKNENWKQQNSKLELLSKRWENYAFSSAFSLEWLLCIVLDLPACQPACLLAIGAMRWMQIYMKSTEAKLLWHSVLRRELGRKGRKRTGPQNEPHISAPCVCVAAPVRRLFRKTRTCVLGRNSSSRFGLTNCLGFSSNIAAAAAAVVCPSWGVLTSLHSFRWTCFPLLAASSLAARWCFYWSFSCAAFKFLVCL